MFGVGKGKNMQSQNDRREGNSVIKGKGFYDNYFKNEHYVSYKYDVGSFCTRRFIRDRIKSKSGRLLEIGTGLYPILFELPQFESFGIDISASTIKKNKRLAEQEGINASFIVTNVEDGLPFPANYFDVIVSAHTLEHIKDDYTVLQECVRVLKPGGEIIFFVPGNLKGKASEEEWKKLGHYRNYNSKRFREMERFLASQLFIEEILFPHKIHNLIWNRLKHFFRYANYFIRKFIKKDNYSFEHRVLYQKRFLPAISCCLDHLDYLFMKNELLLSRLPYNVFVCFRKK